jgi:acyl carrier protein
VVPKRHPKRLTFITLITMSDALRVRDTVFRVLDDMNEQLPPGRRLLKSDATVLIGPSGGLDSLGLVNLIVLLEQRVESEFNVSVGLIEDDVMSAAPIHFADVASLTRHLTDVLSRRG